MRENYDVIFRLSCPDLEFEKMLKKRETQMKSVVARTNTLLQIKLITKNNQQEIELL
jgi:hypothetical protein